LDVLWCLYIEYIKKLVIYVPGKAIHDLVTGALKKTQRKLKRVLDQTGGGAYNTAHEHGARHSSASLK
jgi:hypothetical protein